MLCRQHPQAWCEENDFAREDTQLALTTLLGVGSSGETNDTNDITTLDVLMLLLEGYVCLGLLQLAHDLDANTLCLAYMSLVVTEWLLCYLRTNIEVERIRGGPLCDDAKTDANLLFRLCLSLLEMREVAHIVGELVVHVELVWVGVWLLGGSECIDLVGANLKVLLHAMSSLSN